MAVTKRARPERPPQIVPLGDGLDKYIRMMVYSAPGQGKTVFAGTSPKCLILEADRGTESALVRGSKAEKWIVNDWDDMAEAYTYLRHGGTNDFDWVWIDSLTLFQERGLDHIMADLVAQKSHRQIWAPDKGEYGQNMNRVSKLVRDLKDLPINLGITAHEMHTMDDEGNDLIVPWIQGKGMPEKICAYVGVVGHLELKEKDGKLYNVLETRGLGNRYGKDRYGAIGRMVQPTVPKIIAAINGALKGTTTNNTKKQASVEGDA